MDKISVLRKNVAEYRRVFNLLDKSRNNKVPIDDLKTMLTMLEQDFPDNCVQRFSQALDANGTGTFSYEDFLRIVVPELVNRDIYLQVFQLIDNKNKGYIDEGDLVSVMDMFGMVDEKVHVASILKEADLDNDGKITFDDFYEILNLKN
ncbi:calmodulin-like [Aethina tumida]|uniref:calmodulin-like n=1 Tax=Aethina tumida TaxID=116153 RepID=UPI00096AF529|nr:calmodulin-like [Aethina tumida]